MGNDGRVRGANLFAYGVSILFSGSVLTAIVLLLHLPYLLAHGAQRFPQLEVRSDTAWSAVVFVIASLPVTLTGYKITSLLSRWPKVHFVVVSVFMIMAVTFSVLLFLDIMRDQGHHEHAPPITYGLYTWLSAALCLGALCPKLIFLLANNDPSRFVTKGIWIIVTVLVVVGIACGYSLSVLAWLPNGLGGRQPRTVQFRPKGKTYLSTSSGFTQTVWLLYEDDEDYWLKHVMKEDQSKLVVQTYSREELGNPIATSMIPESPLLRSKKWGLKLPAVKGQSK